ncbi:EPM2AIP1 [Cordylochernes scorpioides]|uniref:EPM2AIP1 n=1 Tax=Cordylochernes scorpioides TaxID=51811 RepID=A0ABY6JYM0_9ARAC|nr:EPM2AIP1 [Cordylochernes scorpioides]
MVETRSGKMQDPAQERIMAEESAKTQPGATIGGDARADPVVLNPNIDIPKYDGTEDPRPWIESLEEIGFLYHWAEYIISRYAAMNMIGSAKTWLDLHKISFTSWEHFKSRLIQDFASDANKEEMKMRLNRMQQWNEPAIRFAEDILVLCNKVDPQMEEETKINWVIGGLKKEYSFALYLNPPKNTNELLRLCKKMDLFEYNYQERVEKSKTLHNVPCSPRPHHQEQWKNAPSFRRPHQNTFKPQVPAPRQYQTNPSPQVSAAGRPAYANSSFTQRQTHQNKVYNKSPATNKSRTEDGRPICFKCNIPGHIARYCRVKFVRIVEEDSSVSQDKSQENLQTDERKDYTRPRLYADVCNDTRTNIPTWNRYSVYEPGELVAVWTPIRKIGKCEKLLRKYFGPYRILEKLSNVNYLIEPKDNPGQDPLIVHVSRIEPYFERIDEALLPKGINNTERFISECRRIESASPSASGSNQVQALAQCSSPSIIEQIVSDEVQRVLALRREEPKIVAIKHMPFLPLTLGGTDYFRRLLGVPVDHLARKTKTCDQFWSRMEKKRKIDSECRKFKDHWNIQYFVIESSNKALCLICNESIAVLKEYNMKRHYETKHSQNYSKYTGIVRTEKFEALKRGLKSQQSLFTKVKTEQLECIIAVVEEMCPEKVNLLKTVSISANTVARRVENIAENISSQLFDKNGHVEWFSLALDESTDVSDTAQVLIYIRGVDKSYEVHEELLDMYSIHGTTTGTDIFKGVEMAINKKNLRRKNLKCITTDGGKNMSGKDKGVVVLVSKAVENDGGSKPLVLHCIIHQQSLCGKCLDMSDVLKPVISTVNFIRSFGPNHRQFRQFIAEIGETDLPYHTAHRPLTELQNNAWLWKLAFYVDLTKHVNELNLRLQGENQHLPDLYTNIKSFRMKLILFQSQLRSKCFLHFKTCEIFSHTTETEFPIDFAIDTLSALKINFDTRFSDFDAIANQIKIFQNPFDADIETLAPELQMEIIDLQCSDIIKNKYENSSLLEFYKSLPLTQFDNLHEFARGLFSVFGTTYLCEKTFSKMNLETPVLEDCSDDEILRWNFLKSSRVLIDSAHDKSFLEKYLVEDIPKISSPLYSEVGYRIELAFIQLIEVASRDIPNDSIMKAGICLNSKGFKFGEKTITFLGNEVSKMEFVLNQKKIRAVRDFATPRSLKEVRSFLGLSSYYHRFIFNYAHLAQTLNYLLKKDLAFYLKREQHAFEALESALISEPAYENFEYSSPTEMHTDASNYRIGAVLVQIRIGKERDIA